jgi:hypothetical protein
MRGNFVMLRGNFVNVRASTDGSVDYNFPSFREVGSDIVATFAYGDKDRDDFIEVRIPADYYNKVTTQGSIGVLEECGLEGTLHTEVSRGSGVVRHYVRVEALTK